MGFYQDRQGILHVEEFGEWPWLVHGFSTRRAGNLGLSAGNSRAQLWQNQQLFLSRLGAGGMRLVTLRQIHSAIVRVVGAATPSGQPGDTLLTAAAGLLAGVKTADCLPVLLVDVRRRVVGAVHTGWRGAAKRAVEKAVGDMRCSFGCRPSDLHAAIGPGIQACCFEVGAEVLEEFASQFVDAEEFCRRDPVNPALIRLPRQVLTNPRPLLRPLHVEPGRVDLAELVRRQLLAGGVPAPHIYNSGLCTVCHPEKFFSHRREKEAAGRMLSVIGARAER
ncbi:MAG: peptidoglycan editing factor PgeF [Acidobacteria bacterium]|nr:peptidoglycan editing factor PgeF [Acidobacteriota bacterium]